MMDADRIKNILNELITTVTPRPQDIRENAELEDLLNVLDSSGSTLIIESDGRRFKVVLSVTEIPATPL